MAIFSTCSMLIVYACVCAAFLSFKSRLVHPLYLSTFLTKPNFSTVNGDPDEDVNVTTNEGTFLNRNANDYPYKSHLQWLRAAFGLSSCLLLILFNGWRSFLPPFSHADFIASYL